MRWLVWCAENLAAGTVFPPLDVVILWGSEESAWRLDPQPDTTGFNESYYTEDYNPHNPQYIHIIRKSSGKVPNISLVI
jgi:hypothetical protein